MISHILAVVIGLHLLLLAACSSPSRSLPPSISRSPTPISDLQSPLSDLRVGWAYEAYPDASSAKMLDDMQRMRAQGANAIWLGHNNPGEVDANKVEPGMSYALYAALESEFDPLHADAQAMADAIKRALDAARAAGLQVILPIGYQIQMGAAWNRAHPDDLRRTADGQPLILYNSGVTASPYPEAYRKDITRYYEWVQQEYVEPYSDTLVMLSLADEPMGGDYSASARQEFVARYGEDMDSLAQNDRWKLGEFQSGVIADYAAWSANQWARINPEILTTMSFHGGETARRVWGLPEFERLFSQTPDNFIVTFDAYMHDDLAAKPATPAEIAQLKLFLSTIGHYSRMYDKPIALWAGVNAWGLAQESNSPLDTPDAVTNMRLLLDVPSRSGGDVWGIFAWNYNVKQQGLENYTRSTTYDPRAMEIAVSRTFPMLRSQPGVSERADPEIAIWAPQREMWQQIAASRASAAPPSWFDSTPYARAFADRNAVIISSLSQLGRPKYLVIAAQGQLVPQELEDLDAHAREGTILLAPAHIADALGLPAQPWQAGLTRLPEGGGTYTLNEHALFP